MAAYYEAAFNLKIYNRNNSDELPLAATYIIDKEHKIYYAFLDTDYRNRAEPSEILENLEK